MVHEKELEVIFTVGLPASGKSTWSKEFVQENPEYVRVSRDDLRKMRGTYWIPEQEDMITVNENQAIITALSHNLNVVIDATNLNVERVEKRIEMIKGIMCKPIKITYKYFDTPIADCIQRDSLRGDESVGAKVIKGMHRKIKGLLPIFVKQPESELPPAIIVDIDGTLAIMGDRSPFDWHRVDEDKVNEPVKLIVNKFLETHEIILITGRDHDAKAKTVKWLDDNGILFDQIYFREAGLHIKDTIVKRELYENNVAGKYRVEFVMDDRNSVVDMWRRELGLVCLSPNYGDF